MTAFHLTIFAATLVVLVLAFLAGDIKTRWWFSEPMFAIASAQRYHDPSTIPGRA